MDQGAQSRSTQLLHSQLRISLAVVLRSHQKLQSSCTGASGPHSVSDEERFNKIRRSQNDERNILAPRPTDENDNAKNINANTKLSAFLTEYFLHLLTSLPLQHNFGIIRRIPAWGRCSRLQSINLVLC